MSRSRSFKVLLGVLLSCTSGVALAAQPGVIDVSATILAPAAKTHISTTQTKTSVTDAILAPAAKGSAEVAPQVTKAKPQGNPVDYEADRASYDRANKMATLTGNVVLKQDGRILQADKVIYNVRDDIATAEGHVVITDPSGDVHYAQSVELSDHMRKGLVNEIFTVMADGSRVWAASGERENAQRYKLKNATYTACKACADNPQKRPPWELKAKRVDVLQDEQRVVYHHAWLEMGGVPVFYTPYFSHPDASVKQKSGFLTPHFGWNSDLGAYYSQPYYWAISPSTDATFTLMPTSEESPLMRGEFRKRFESAYLKIDASTANAERTDSVGGVEVVRDAEWRGHFFGDAAWDIDNNWRAGASVRVTSDDQYLRQYDFSDDDVLESRVYAERFDGRDYSIIEGLAFQDLRTDSSQTDQPNILPYARMSMMGDPNGTLGGRWELDSSFLSLARDGSGQDVWRISSRASWQREDIVPMGLVLTSEVGVRADGYVTTNRVEAATNPSQADTEREMRFVPDVQLSASYPLKRDFKGTQLRIEPIATLYAAPNVNNGTSIPNEDSQDAQLDAGNLMEGNRFSGIDRVEDKSHVAYGLKAGLYSYEGGSFDAFLGQSYNFYSGQTPFAAGSGLDSRSSDYVGAMNASFDEGRHTLSYRFQVDSDTMTSQRHELYARTKYGPVEVDGNYMYAKGVEGTSYEVSREQIALGSTIDLSDAWRLRADSRYDLSDETDAKGLRRAVATLSYTHECYNVAVTADRNFADASSGVQDTTLMFRIGLKNLGEYETKGFSFGGEE